jgi:hypothetical protein
MNTSSMLRNEGDLSEELENMPITDSCNDIRYVTRFPSYFFKQFILYLYLSFEHLPFLVSFSCSYASQP